MPFKNYDYALKYQLEYYREQCKDNYEHILEINRKCYHNHIESERLRMRKKYKFNKECKRLRNILLV